VRDDAARAHLQSDHFQHQACISRIVQIHRAAALYHGVRRYRLATAVVGSVAGGAGAVVPSIRLQTVGEGDARHLFF